MSTTLAAPVMCEGSAVGNDRDYISLSISFSAIRTSQTWLLGRRGGDVQHSWLRQEGGSTYSGESVSRALTDGQVAWDYPRSSS